METRNCQNCKRDFDIKSEDLDFYTKFQVPKPTFCPECRFIRRLVFRNERKMFKATDANTGKEIFSLFPNESGRKIVTQEEWFSDTWDAMDYGKEYDFSKSFFTQLFELDKEVPIYALNETAMVRSDYCGNASYLKDCYLIFNSNRTETSMYGNAIDRSKDCVDCSNVGECEICYESFWLANCYQCYFCIMCVESRNMWFSRDCLGCSDCFGCTNLRNQSYCIFNEKYSKEDYHKKIAEMSLDTREGIDEARKVAREFWDTQPHKFHQGIRNQNSSGAYVSECNNVVDCYLIRQSENLKYCQYMVVPGNKDCMDASVWGENTELCYETSVCGDKAYNLKFSWDCWPNVRDSEYSIHLKSCADCFGCVGLRNKQYCILNKQYSKEEYEALVPRIKKHMDEMPYVDAQGLIYKYGEFFPIELSMFGYNNTPAQEQFPITKEEAVAKNYPWIEVAKGNYAITMNASDVNGDIAQVDESILKEVLGCGLCSGAYRVQVNELSFLKKENLPLPNMCPECRHKRRISDRLRPVLYHRICDNGCGNEFDTAYPPETKNPVFCETCYQNLVA
jgi:hypothetical protein